MDKFNFFSVRKKRGELERVYFGGIQASKNEFNADVYTPGRQPVLFYEFKNSGEPVYTSFILRRNWGIDAGNFFTGGISYIIDREGFFTDTVGNDSLRSNRDIVLFFAPNLEGITVDAISSSEGLYYLPKLSQIDRPTDNNFGGFRKLFLNKSFENDTGVFITRMRDYVSNYTGKEIIYIQNTNIPEDIISHTINQINTNSVDFTFQVPLNSFNNLGYLEIWVNGGFNSIHESFSNVLIENLKFDDDNRIVIFLKDEYYNEAKKQYTINVKTKT